MSQAGIKKKGYLLKLPVTGIVKKWAKRWCVLFATTHEGVVRIEYYVDEVSGKSQIGKRTIPLRDSSKIQQGVGDKVHPYVFEFTTQLGQHVFAAETHSELEEWMDGIRDAVHEDRMKRKMNKSQTKRAPTTSSEGADTSQPKAQSSNQKPAADIGYSPAPGGFSKGSTQTASNITSGTYRITLEENDTTDELDLHGSFNLVLAPTTLTIADVNTGKPIYKWHYKFLKSFGKQSGRFNFEVGKTPQGGTGSYRCITTCSKEIFGVVNRNIKIIRERLETARRDQQPQQQQGQPHRPNRRSGVVDDTVPGKYRSSQKMEGAVASIGEPIEQQPNQGNGNLTAQDVANNYSLAGQEGDISALYAKVQKPPKGGAPPTSPFEPQQQQGEQQTSPAAAAAQQQAPAQFTNRFSYDDTLDARDSALIQLDGPLLNVEAFTPKKPAPDLSNIMDLELNNDFFSQTASTAATGVDPWGDGGSGGGAKTSYSGGNTGMQSSNPWGSAGGQQFGGSGQQYGGGQHYGGGGQQYGGGGQQFGGGGQQYGGGGQQYGGGGQQYGGGGQQQYGGYGGGYGQPSSGGYGQSTMYGRPAQQGQWGMGGQQQSAAFGRQAPAQTPAQTQPQAPQKALSQQEFDQLWEELNTNF